MILQQGLFQHGNFTLHSGETSAFKVECDVLLPSDWDTLAALVASKYRFGYVEGVPRGGLPFCAALQPFATHQSTDGLLIVDDVLTSGASMKQHRAGRCAMGIVVFSRGPCPPWVTPIWQLTL